MLFARCANANAFAPLANVFTHRVGPAGQVSLSIAIAFTQGILTPFAFAIAFTHNMLT